MTEPARPAPNPKAAWRWHPRLVVLTIAVGQFSDFFLFGMRVPLLPYLVREHLRVPEDQVQDYVALILASFSVAMFVTAVPAGWLADIPTWRGRLYLAGLAALLWATVTFYTSSSLFMLIASRMLNGMSAAILCAAGYAMVADAVAPGDLGKTFGTIRSIVAVGELAGPPLGGIVYSSWGFDGILIISLGVLAVDLILRLMMKEKPTASGGENKLGNGDASLGYGTIESAPASAGPASSQQPACKPLFPIALCLRDPQLLAALFLSFVQYFILGSFDSTLSLEVSERFGLSPEQVGVVYLSLVIPMLVLAPIFGSLVDSIGPRVVAVVGYGCFSVALALAGLVMILHDRHPTFGVGTFIVLLSIQGVCIAAVSTPSVVQAKMVVEAAVEKDPARFGPRGATGQMFGLNTLVSSFGLLMGDYFSALFRKLLGYGFMNFLLLALCNVSVWIARAFLSDERIINSK